MTGISIKSFPYLAREKPVPEQRTNEPEQFADILKRITQVDSLAEPKTIPFLDKPTK